MIKCENLFINGNACTLLGDRRDDMMAKMNKEQLNTSVSKETKQNAEKYGASEVYSSTSNFVETAIWYFIGAQDKEHELQLEELNKKYKLELDECKKELQKAKEEAERNSSILLQLLSAHQELIKEANELSK